MVGTAAADGSVKCRGDRVTYILREPEQHHRFGVSSLALGKKELYTAGRDGTVRAWNLPPADLPSEQTQDVTSLPSSLTSFVDSSSLDPYDPPSPKCVKTFDEHVDWVNDVLYLAIPGAERLISCSSDTTLKVWDVNNPSCSLRTLNRHSDYVKALAPVPSGVASGSLDGRVLVWDLAIGGVSAEFGADVNDSQTRNGSVYCIAGTATGNVLVSGSTDKTISVWDIRDRNRIVCLRGHTDAVRCLTMKHDSSLLLSGGTDAAVKLWDFRLQRCIRNLEPYSASVWAIAASDRFDSFISGGRDGSVWHTDIDGDVGTMIVPAVDRDPRSNMVLDVVLSSNKSGVWVSTTGSTVRLWSLSSEISSQMGSVLESRGSVTNGPRPPSRDGKIVTVQSKRTSSLLYVIPGLPGIIAQHVMNDRRHVLTCDTQGEYKMWDITRGTLVESLGILENVSFEEAVKMYDSEVAVSSWFHVDIRLGSLMVRLEKATVANAEIYAVDAGLDVPTEEVKVNVGEHVVLGLFKGWLEKYKQLESNGEKMETCVPQTEAQKNAANRAADLPQYKFSDHIPVIITKVSSPVPILRRTTGGFEGTDERHLPQWVVDLVRDGKGQSRELVKISFSLEPDEGSDLPLLPNTTLNAPKVLRVRKVMSYLAKELRHPITETVYEQNQFEILCNGKVLPMSMSLAAVRQFRWRSPDDLKLFYRLKSSSLS